MMNEPRGISMSAAKFIYKHLVAQDNPNLCPEVVAEEYDLWLVDEWTHVGYCIIICLDNLKLVEAYKKGNQKLLESLIGKTIKFANMTVDGELIRELMPLVIKTYW